ncbi:MAG TPA: hypothetical protein VII75_12960 [Thermoanaerobaculia bacterium]
MRNLALCFTILLAAAPLHARGRDGHYERPGENDEASLDIKSLPGNRIKVTGIALWNTRNEKYGPNIGELDFEADLKDDTATWTDSDGYRITIRFSRNALDVSERAADGHFGMNVTFAGHYTQTGD